MALEIGIPDSRVKTMYLQVPRPLTNKAGISFSFMGIVLATPPSIKDSRLGSETVAMSGSEGQFRGQREGEYWETNPIELTCFLSIACQKMGETNPREICLAVSAA